MIFIPIIFVAAVSYLFELLAGKLWLRSIMVTIAAIVLTFIVIGVDYIAQTSDTEVWSGTVVDWEHIEAYDEWIPESCSTDSEGKKSCTPGHWKHHNAVNKIKTSDDGWFYVKVSPDGTRKFNDKWPRETSELREMWPDGTPSASIHVYTNKVKASYSIYRHQDIDEKDYPDLPKYPDIITNLINIDRIVGNVPNKVNASKRLAEVNSELNKFIPDPENPGKKRSWKQVNLIFVNLGDNIDITHGLALQNLWSNGNKNDFIVSFSMSDDGTVNWVHAFSWSEVDILKMEIRDFIMDYGKIDDFVPIIDHVKDLVADKFERKQFADFDYLQIKPSKAAHIVLWILCFATLVGQAMHYREVTLPERRRYERYRRM